MRIYHVPCGESTIELGRAGENLAQQIVFNVSDWLAALRVMKSCRQLIN